MKLKIPKIGDNFKHNSYIIKIISFNKDDFNKDDFNNKFLPKIKTKMMFKIKDSWGTFFMKKKEFYKMFKMKYYKL